MGIWGTAIFSDDLASDIRGEYRDALGEGLSGPEATRRILAAYASSVADPDESSVVWLALAAVQWKLGRLEGEVRRRALEVIDSGSDLVRWGAGSKEHAQRRAVLQKLREQILSAPPAARKVARRTLCECPWSMGEVIAYRLLSGSLVLFELIGTHTDKGGTYPVCMLLDWNGTDVPPKSEIERMTMRRSRADYQRTIHGLMLVGLSMKWRKRFQDIKVNVAPLHAKIISKVLGKMRRLNREPTTIVHFKFLDGFLKENYFLD